jgi:hypothetical protein
MGKDASGSIGVPNGFIEKLNNRVGRYTELPSFEDHLITRTDLLYRLLDRVKLKADHLGFFGFDLIEVF